MAPGALDARTKEMLYLAVSMSNSCDYCIVSHTAAARKAGMTDAMLHELIAVVGMANETNRLVSPRIASSRTRSSSRRRKGRRASLLRGRLREVARVVRLPEGEAASGDLEARIEADLRECLFHL